ncbi:MAG: 50S ribosomal protein L4 [Bacillota bacterium]|jgi:large subunit ribosomal protein L4|nr:50S ribosomal protein L4 [Bacillota bacterium]
MPKVPVLNVEGNPVGEIDLSDEVFGQEINSSLLHQVVKMHLANARRGTADTKTRGRVAGGGRKPWRQKGTGRARAGSIRSPLWRKGGVVFGPHPRDYSYVMPKKARRAAMKSALSSKVLENNLVVVDGIALSEPKTKTVVKILENLKVDGKALLVTAIPNENVKKSTRNIVGVKTFPVGNLNVYDLLTHAKLVITRDAVERVEEVLA